MDQPERPYWADKLDPGSVVQLSPSVGNRMFAGCMLVVTETKSFGVQGYVQSLGENNKPGGQAYYRATWDELVYIGHAAWITK